MAVVFCAGLGVLQAQPAAPPQPNVDFNVSGTSTIRSWTCTVSGRAQGHAGKTGSPPLPGLTGGVQAATLTVPVKAFKCPSDEMTQHLFEVMKPEQHAEITYRLERYVVNGRQGEATGTITIAGVTAPLSVPMTIEESAQGLQVAGSTRLDMTKFGVAPPVVMLGLLKVGPQIRIEFKGVVAR